MTKFTTASKKAMSLLLAVLLAFSCMAVAAFAEAPSYTKYILSSENCTLDVAKKTITVKKAAIKIGEINYGIEFSVNDDTVASAFDKDGNTLFYNLVEGKTYIIKANFTYNEEVFVAADDYSVKLKNAQNAPLAPIPEKIKATTITVKAVTDAEYAILAKGSEDTPVYGESNAFKSLTPETQYTIYVRYKETESAYASPASTITVKTLAASDQTVPATPVLADKTNTTITVEKVDGQVYSIDGGENWQSNPCFKDLSEKTSYTIITRKVYDPEKQEETPVSDGLAVITNKRACYAASLDKCKMNKTKDEPIYAETAFSFSFVCDNPGTADLVYGDTRYVAYTYTTSQSGTDKYSCDAAKSFTPAAKGDLKFYVNFIKQKYNGSEWINVDVETKAFTFTVVAKYNKILEGFKKIANLFLNTVPAAISKFLNGDTLSKIVGAITNLGK